MLTTFPLLPDRYVDEHAPLILRLVLVALSRYDVTIMLKDLVSLLLHVFDSAGEGLSFGSWHDLCASTARSLGVFISTPCAQLPMDLWHGRKDGVSVRSHVL